MRAEVALRSPFDEALRVTLVAAAAGARVVLPSGSVVELGAGERHAYDAPIERPLASFAYAAARAVLPAGVHEVALSPPPDWEGVASPDAIVFARDLDVAESLVGATRVRLATVGPPRAEDVAYLARGLAYVSAQHANAPDELLVVRAPNEAVDGSVSGNATIVLSSDAQAEELARLVVALHRAYRVVEVPPASAAWFREGEERLHTHLSLLAAGLRTSSQVDDTFTRARAVADPDARLPQAPAGSTLARQKGLVVVRALDFAIRNASDGAAGLAELVERLEATTARLDSSAIEREAEAVAGRSLAPFFETYVYGSEWPPTPGVRDAADVFVLSLALRPARASAGEQVVVELAAVNRGTQPSELDLVLRVDGEPARTVPVRLDVGERGNATATLVLSARGEHAVELGGRNATLRILSPARLSLARASTAPEEPRAGDPFTLLVYVENAGETSGRGRVEVYEGGRLAQRTSEAVVDGGATDALTLPLRAEEAGLHVYEIRLVGAGEGARIEHEVNVALGDTKDAPAGWVGILLLSVLLALRRR